MEYFHLTTPQQNIWNLQKYYGDTAIANLCGATFYKEKRDSELLRQAILGFIRNQSGMRLRFFEDGEPKQYISEDADAIIPVMEFASMGEFDAYAEKFAGEPLGLVDCPMYRFVVFQVENRSGILVLLSHLISDAWTFGLMANQFDEAYRKLAGENDSLLLTADYRDYIDSEKDYLISDRYKKDTDYWEKKYEVCPEESRIKIYPVSSSDIRAKRISRLLKVSLEEKMDAYCRTYPVTPAVLFETALVIYLSKINQEKQSVTIGIPVLNRSNAKEKKIAGMFVSTMPLTIALTESMTVAELAKQIGREHKDIFRHQKYPYANILKFLREKQEFSGNLYDVMISYQNAKTHTGADTKWYCNGYSEVPLTIHIDNRDENDSHTINMDYQTAVFGDEEAGFMIDRLEYILEQMVGGSVELIRDISIVPPKEFEKVVYDFNDTYVDYPRDKCVHELFSEQAQRTPDKVALVFEDKKFTYRQLDEMSNSLAYFLREKGVGRNDVVPIIAKRSWHVIVAMLGVMKAGGAYMPIDPNYPANRIAYMIETVKSNIVLLYGYKKIMNIDFIELKGLEFIKKKSTVKNLNQPNDAAYVIFTSGSTGTPKGITCSHRNVCNYAYNSSTNKVCHSIIKKQHTRIVSVTSIMFDIFVTESILSLLNGVCIYFANDDEIASQNKLSKLLKRNRINVLQTTPTKMKIYILDKENLDYLRELSTIVLGGELLSQELYHELKKITSAEIYNIYGPAETTVWSTNEKVENDNITIGNPIANTQIYIIDSDNNLMPIGAVGELCIAGDGVGKGYLNRPELTAERFVPNPFATEENHHGKTMYHTGDLARWRKDGKIEYFGRIDTQVKIRGLRIELGEIESVMGSMEGIGLTAVADKRDADNRQYLVGYYTSDRGIEEQKLRHHLVEKLPKYMVPNFFMRLDTMPMTPSGKIDRKILPMPNFSMQAKVYTEPVTDVEKRLSEIWEHLLHVKKVGKTDDFFELGGDSLLAISMLNKIEKNFQVEISIKDIMERSSLEQLALCIEQACIVSSLVAYHEKKYVLMPQQKAIYAIYSKNPATLVYNMPAKINLSKRIDRNKLEQSIVQVLDHHKLLKSYIQVENNEIYGIYDKDAEIVIEQYMSGEETEFIRPFDLEKAPLIHIGFMEDTLLFDIHHIIADGDSLNIILRDIMAVYEGKKLQESKIEYSDYTKYFYGLNTTEHKSYFKEMLKCDFEPVILPKTSYAGQGGKSKLYLIPKEIFLRTQVLAKENGLTDTMLFLGAYGILLSKYTGKKDILSSIVLQNRVHTDVQNLVGMFVNTLPIHLEVKENTQEYMQGIKQLLLHLFLYQELPFGDIANAVGMEDKAVVNTSFVYQGDGEKILTLNGQKLIPQFMDTHTSKFDFTMELIPLDEGCRIRIEYNLAKYEECLIDNLADAYIRILLQMGKEKVANISILSENEYQKIIESFNDTYVDYPRNKCIHELFFEQVQKTPNKIALIFEDKKFTYQQLDEMSNSLAHFLREKGVKRNDVVPIIAKRSWHVIVAMLGIMKAGGAYMPIDPDYPINRITYMIGEAKANLILTYNYSWIEKIRNNVSLQMIDYYKDIKEIENKNISEDLCYVLFTSGTTGQPKAVSICHSNLGNFVNYNRKNEYQYFMINKCNCMLSDTTFIFDISIFEIFLSLLNGISIILTKDLANAVSLAKLIKKYNIDVIHITPTKLLALLQDKSFQEAIAKVKILMIGAEIFTKDLFKIIRQYTDAVVYNGYGPTETTIGCSFKKIGKGLLATNSCQKNFGNNVTIGKPIANTQIYILGPDDNPMPIGAAGELCIAGNGVGKGYLNHPELTAERFVPNPFATEENRHGKTMYRTGDLACWRHDGEIEYLGRIDTQVKIHGIRIELGEIESIMNSIEGINQATVTGRQDADNRQYLVGYYISDTEIDERKLRQQLSEKLPQYMIPNFFMRLDFMPMTPTGKIDRKNLPIPDITTQTAIYIKPETDTEKKLSEIWQQLLLIEKAGKKDDFFMLGGDSLLAIFLTNEIETVFRSAVSVKDVMEHSVLEQLAKCIEQSRISNLITVYCEKKYILLPQQKAIYAVCSKNPKTLAYNMPTKINLPKEVDRTRLRQSICKVLNCHKLLNSCIQIVGDEIYGIYLDDMKIEFEEYNNGEEKNFVRPFDLRKAPLIRIAFTEDALLFDTHHIIVDGNSLNIILHDIMCVYQGGILHKTNIEYSDYSRYFYSLNTSEHKKYFKKMLSCDFEPVVLPKTKSAGSDGKSNFYHVPKKIFSTIKVFAKENGLTDTMVLLSAYGILLSKYTGKKDILSSIVLQNRVHTDVRGLVGMFVNTLPIHLEVKENTQEYMQGIKQLMLHLFQYQELSFWDIANAVGMEDKTVINTSFVYQGDGEKTLTLNGQKLIPQFMDTNTSKFDFTMELIPLDEGCRIRMEYNLAKYEKCMIDNLADSYIRILSQIEKEKTADISILSKGEYHKIIEKFNDTYVDYPRNKCVHELFSEQVKRTPDKIALVFEDKKFTYCQLDEMSNSLAHFLREKGVGRNDVVPVIAKRSWHVIVAMLGILKAGGAYLLIDYQYPYERICYLVKECNASLVLVYNYQYEGGISLEQVCEYLTVNTISNINCKDDIACVLHTSGSTGVPKVTALTHTNIAHCIKNSMKLFQGTKQVISTTITVFDAFTQETVIALCNGISVILLNEKQMTCQIEFEKILLQYTDSFLFQTPTKLLNYIRNSESGKFIEHIKSFVLGGEVFTEELYEYINERNKSSNIYNEYGPTETTVFATVKKLKNGKDITIGHPIANTQVYILGSDNNPMPIGAPGELCIAGEGVGKGYLNRPELTAERFVPNPFATEENRHGKTMYRTGDLARWREDGEIEYLGRIDTQVKIRGLRIELGEIESVMSSMEGIGLTAVADKRDADNRQYLVGYYTSDGEIDERKLRRHLSEKLPKYMVPNFFMRLDAMPITPSGKTDRKSLPAPDFVVQMREYTAPVTENEKKLCHLLEEMLHMERIGTQDDFFELGGDSLTAIEYMAKAHGIGIDFALQNVFDYPTVQSLCGFLKRGNAPKVLYEASDFNKYQSLFAGNIMDESLVLKKKSLGNILLTGATGFLGAHVLDALMREETGKIYCLVRDGEKHDGCERFRRILQYYFGNRYEKELDRRLVLVSGDIEKEDLAENIPKDVQTVIHTAASVSHYGSYEYFHRVNVEGTRHVVNYAKSVGAKLVHISTLSVSGNSMADDFTVYRSEEEKHFYETSFYIGQPLDNVYVHSKFEAEKAVYDAMLEGLDAAVIRVGNLTNRAADYKFQPNYVENAFLTRVKAVLEFGLFPDYLMPLYSEFSPVDLTAEGIVRIAQYADGQSVFHLNSNRPIYFEHLMEVLHGLGISMKVVSGEEFNRALQRTIQNAGTEYIFEALQNDIDEQGRLVYDSNIHIENDFTVWFLKKTGFEWNETDREYISGYIEYFRRIGYLKV